MVEEKNKGMSLDDAFGDDENVEYAKPKPKKAINKMSKQKISDSDERIIEIKQSKPITELKKGDKIKINSLNLEVDANVVLIDHGSSKEMALELFDPKTDKDYQLRYFPDNLENSIEFYELDEIVYNKVGDVEKAEW